MSEIAKIKKEVEVLRSVLKYTAERAENLLSELEKMEPANPRKRRNLKKERFEYQMAKFANK